MSKHTKPMKGGDLQDHLDPTKHPSSTPTPKSKPPKVSLSTHKPHSHLHDILEGNSDEEFLHKVKPEAVPGTSGQQQSASNTTPPAPPTPSPPPQSKPRPHHNPSSTQQHLIEPNTPNKQGRPSHISSFHETDSSTQRQRDRRSRLMKQAENEKYERQRRTRVNEAEQRERDR